MSANQVHDPVERHVQTENQPAGQDHSGGSPTGLSGMKTIMIVDDEPRNIKLLAAKLPQRDYKIISALNGEKALALVEKELPDLILLDVMMPGINGYEVTKKLKNEPGTKNIPIILVTALDGPEEKTKGLKAGADDFLNKPVHYAELITRVRSLLRSRNIRKKTNPPPPRRILVRKRQWPRRRKRRSRRMMFLPSSL